MKKVEPLNKICSMTAPERLEVARDKLCGGVVTTLLNHLVLHENARWLTYEIELATQVAKSRGAHAFTALQTSTIHYELLRICTFWDRVDLESTSIPTIAALSDCQGVKDVVFQANDDTRLGSDPDFASEWTTSRLERLAEGLRLAEETEASLDLKRARNFRDKLAHQVERTRLETKGAVARPKYGDERKLLEGTVKVVDLLDPSLRMAGFHWESERERTARNASYFWQGVTIDVKG